MGTINLSKETVNLSKGGKINLSKCSSGLSKVMVGLGWDPVKRNTGGLLKALFGGDEKDYDLDAFIVMLRDGRWSADMSDIVFYNNLTFNHKGKTVIKHQGDNLTGHGAAGDKEQIIIDLENMPKSVDQLIVAVTLYHGVQRRQSLGKVENTFIRVVDKNDDFELCNYGSKVMSDDYNAQSFIAGRFYRDGSDWQFEAIGQSTRDNSVGEVAKRYL